jgi:predicted GTPase
VLNKLDQAKSADVNTVLENLRQANPRAKVVRAESVIQVDGGEAIQGKRVLVIEDGPTLTHGGMTFGAGIVAAKRFGAAAIVDPRRYAVGEIADTFKAYPGTGQLLPAMGYGERQMKDLEATIAAVPCDLVLVATPVDLGRVIQIAQKTLRVRYELHEIGGTPMRELLEAAVKRAVVSR